MITLDNDMNISNQILEIASEISPELIAKGQRRNDLLKTKHTARQDRRNDPKIEEPRAVQRYGGYPPHPNKSNSRAKKISKWEPIKETDLIPASEEVSESWISSGFNFACDLKTGGGNVTSHIADRANRDFVPLIVIKRYMTLMAQDSSNRKKIFSAWDQYEKSHKNIINIEKTLGRHGNPKSYEERFKFKVTSKVLNFPIAGFVKYRLPDWFKDWKWFSTQLKRRSYREKNEITENIIRGSFVVASTPELQDPDYFPSYANDVNLIVESITSVEIIIEDFT